MTAATQMARSLWNIKKLDKFRPRLIVDVGACSGTNGLYGLFRDPEPMYLLVEPLSEFNAVLTKHMAEKPHRIINCCLSSTVGTRPFKVYSTMKHSSHLVETDVVKDSPNAQIITVPVDTLDNIVRRACPDVSTSGVDLVVKIDVQGAESEVIEGGRKTIASNNCLLIVEISTSRRNAIKVFALLDSLGYVLCDCIDFVRFPGTTKVTSQFDAVFARV